MIKRITILILWALSSIVTYAQTPGAILDSAIAAVDRAGGITANYTVNDGQQALSGRIAMKGTRFAMMSRDIKSWYDGNTQWTFSTATGEVNITEPTEAELQMTNPLATLRAFKASCVATKTAPRQTGCYSMTLAPKQRSQIRFVVLTVDGKSSLPVRADVLMRDGTQATLTVTDVKTGQTLPDSSFVFNKNLVPEGTPIVDLR